MRPASGGPVGGIGSEPDAWTQLVEEEDRKRQRLSYTLSVYRGFGSGANKLLVLSFLTAIGGGMAWFVLILYIYELFPELTNVAIIFSIASWTSVVLFLPGGALVDRYDHRNVLALSILLGTIALVLFATTQYVWMIVLAQVLNGMGWAISRTALNAMMAEKTSDRRRKYLFSLQSMVSMFGVALASVMAGIWTITAREWFGMDLLTSYRILFLFSAVMNVVAIAVTMTISKGEEDRGSKEEELPSLVDEDEDEEEARKKGLRFIVRFSTPMALIGLGAGLVVPFFQLYYLLKFDVDVSSIAWLFAATQLAMAASFLLIPNLAERRGTVGAVVRTQGLAVVNLAIIPFAPTFFMAAPFHLLRMSLMNASTPIQNALMMGAVRPQDRGKATGIGQFMWTITNATAITLSGYVMDTYGLDAPFVFAVSLYTAAVFLFWYWFRNVKEM